MRKASRGEMALAVDDNPDGIRDDPPAAPACWPEPQSGTLVSTRHCNLISAMFANVV
jgi:hypothetical protein